MSETDKRPARQRATITLDIEKNELVIKGKWFDKEGKKHDLGFAKLPTWAQAETMIHAMARRLSNLGFRDAPWPDEGRTSKPEHYQDRPGGQ